MIYRIVAAVFVASLSAAQVSVQCPSFPCTVIITAPAPAPTPTPTPAPTGKFAIGARVSVTASTTGGVYVRSTSSSTSTILGIQPVAALGVIVAGPVVDATDKQTRWSVNYDTGVDGWSIESRLQTSTAPPIVVAHGVQLNWNPVTGAVSYNPYRGTAAGGPYAKNTSVPVAGTSYLDPSVVSGNTYYYVVRALNSTGLESGNSNEAKVVVP